MEGTKLELRGIMPANKVPRSAWSRFVGKVKKISRRIGRIGNRLPLVAVFEAEIVLMSNELSMII
jgi:hypothetical protein